MHAGFQILLPLEGLRVVVVHDGLQLLDSPEQGSSERDRFCVGVTKKSHPGLITIS